MSTPPVPDGPDTELAAANDALSYLDAYARSRDHAHSGDARRWVEAVRAVLARPAAGRDLTAQDVEHAIGVGPDRVAQSAPDYLNEIARPAVARTDGQCTCGDPSAADLVHHTEAPCRTVEELRTGRTDGQPHPDPRGRYDVPDPYDHPGWPLVSRIVAIATDTAPTMPNETDGVDNAVTGLLADQSWRDHVAMADVMGLVGDWGTDDVVQAVTDALHEYPRLRALVARTDGQPPADEPRAILPHDWARREVLFLAREVVQYRGSQLEGAKLDQLAEAITTLDEKVAEYRAAQLSAAPADDTAAPDQRHPQTVGSLAHAEAMFFRDHARRGYALLRGMARRSSELRRAGQPIRDNQGRES